MSPDYPRTCKELGPLKARNKPKQLLEWTPKGKMSLEPCCFFPMHDVVTLDLLLFFSTTTHLCPAGSTSQQKPRPRSKASLLAVPSVVGWTQVYRHAPGPRRQWEGQYLHLGAQEAMVSALGVCQATHVFGGQLGYHAGPRGHTIAGVPKAHVQNQGARWGFSHRRLWLPVGLWWAEAQTDCREKNSQVRGLVGRTGFSGLSGSWPGRGLAGPGSLHLPLAGTWQSRLPPARTCCPSLLPH